MPSVTMFVTYNLGNITRSNIARPLYLVDTETQVAGLLTQAQMQVRPVQAEFSFAVQWIESYFVNMTNDTVVVSHCITLIM